MPTYRKPPITEAVIGIQLAENVELERLEKVSERLGKLYARQQPLLTAKLTVMPDGKTSSVVQKVGTQFMSEDGADITFLKSDGIVISRLAPYLGWGSLEERFLRDWKIWKKPLRGSRSGRLGVRYINRIDVPCSLGAPVKIEEYFRCSIETPDPEMNFLDYHFRFVTPLTRDGVILIVNSGTAPEQIIDHCSFVLDIDVGHDHVDVTGDALVGEIAMLRNEKNMAFETYVTATAKELFEAL